MSVLNLTFSYVRPYIYQASGALEDLTFKNKKNLLKNLVIAFTILVAFYIYLTGTIVSQNIRRENLSDSLNKAILESTKVESAFINESHDKSPEYFIARGYEEPKNLDIIKRVENVAAYDVEKQAHNLP